MSINTQIAFLALILLAILVLVFWLFHIKKTDDYIKIYLKLRNVYPNVSAFCLGYDSQRARYHNVTVVDAEKFEFKDQYDSFPMDLDARLTIQKNHGIISDQKNGFSISEVGVSSSGSSSGSSGGSLIACPPGFVGPTCQLAPICLAGQDDDKFFPLTTEQFNNLGLYNMRISTAITRARRQRQRRRVAAAVIAPIRTAPYHPRIRVHCMPKASHNNEYELQVCPENKLLNFETLKCQPYDVCSDMIDGTKHHYEINDSSANALKDPRAYYLCDKRTSRLQSCSDETFFSVAQMACVSKSRCFGKHNGLTFPRNAKSFVRCENDVETIIECPKHGVDPNSLESELKCRVNLCTTGHESVNDGVLEYFWRKRLCDKNDQPYYDVCTSENKGKHLLRLLDDDDKSKDYEWSDKFDIAIEHWPDKVLLPSAVPPPSSSLERVCTDKFDINDILISSSKTDDPVIPLSWGRAWKNSSDFSIKRRRFVCCDNTTEKYKYGWDLMRLDEGKSMSESARLVHCSDFSTIVDRSSNFYDTSHPCVNEPIKFAKNLFCYRFDLVSSHAIFLPNKNLPLLIGIKHTYPKPLLGADTFWPCINNKTKIVSFCLLLREQDEIFSLVRVTSTKLPDGFSQTSSDNDDDDDLQPLSLAGLRDGYPSIEQRQKYFWLIIYSGVLNIPQIPDGSTTTLLAKIVDHNDTAAAAAAAIDVQDQTFRRINEDTLLLPEMYDSQVCQEPLVMRKGLKLTNTVTNETVDIPHYNLFYIRKIANPVQNEKTWRVYYSGLEFDISSDTKIYI